MVPKCDIRTTTAAADLKSESSQNCLQADFRDRRDNFDTFASEHESFFSKTKRDPGCMHQYLGAKKTPTSFSGFGDPNSRFGLSHYGFERNSAPWVTSEPGGCRKTQNFESAFFSTELIM